MPGVVSANTREVFMEQVQEFTDEVRRIVGQVIVGNDRAIELLIIALLCEGHVLLEDVPGVGKTMLARSLAIALNVDFRRLQCTPDLLPSDITGVSIFNQETRTFQFIKGPVFTQILLADEINRATPRAQAALLECMGESQITVEGVTRALSRPFMVLATQNPIEYEGTFPLPEAQLDRFLFKCRLGYLDFDHEVTMMENLGRQHPIETLTSSMDGAHLSALSRMVWEVHVEDSLKRYIVSLVHATRTHGELELGASPRSTLALYRGAQAKAAVQGRDHAQPDDIQELIPYILPHRCIMKADSALRGRTAEQVISEILDSTPLDLELPAAVTT